MSPIHTILFATDLSGKPEDTFALACSIARDRGARLIALHVVPGEPLLAPATPLGRERAKHTEEDLRSYKRQMGEKLHALHGPGNGLVVDYVLKEGDPATVIRRTAQQFGCDLLVLETHGKSEAERHVLGSVEAEVVGHPPCPVLLLGFPR